MEYKYSFLLVGLNIYFLTCINDVKEDDLMGHIADLEEKYSLSWGVEVQYAGKVLTDKRSLHCMVNEFGMPLCDICWNVAVGQCAACTGFCCMTHTIVPTGEIRDKANPTHGALVLLCQDCNEYFHHSRNR
ncbi:hypothetical protein EI42_06132 [Thermosporothrix hazakensis]|jgi:hypothetical protein|uniref:Uncharacterized protein n=1 Tax=Thermosporothrix hazakensis TaxID=644383 RepID=A0A326TT59_THEHA|nr:hypothetical protein [Thermosporothrix hazakensis]PZW19319.1 hypothetical protein EI42_06132 [Thermosporothrix hazakensis]GCE48242.1 hypothetical protein KTH_31110 [Thermosporothrix hazakensis]